MSWLDDLPGYRDVLNGLSALMPRRRQLRFRGGVSVQDNDALSCTDIVVATGTSFRWVAPSAPAAGFTNKFICVVDSVAPSLTEAHGEYVVTQGFDASYLSFKCAGTPLATDSVVAVVRKNGADTALTITIAAASTAIVSDAAHVATFAQGDRVSIRTIQTSTEAQAAWRGVFQLG